jgi:hypothetical protein
MVLTVSRPPSKRVVRRMAIMGFERANELEVGKVDMGCKYFFDQKEMK